MSKSFFVSLATGSLLLAGCNSLDQSLTDCDNLREEIVELSEEDRFANGFALIKIRNPVKTSETDKKIICRGDAVWTDGDKTRIQYTSYIDEDGDRMIEYETF
jgi:hypothetical protein